MLFCEIINAVTKQKISDYLNKHLMKEFETAK